jgi:hypothetical protein
MAYELYIFPPEGTKGLEPRVVVDAFAKTGLTCSEQPDDLGHWLVLEGWESSLNLTIKGGVATGAGFRYAPDDDPILIENVAEAFKSIGWLVSDDEGML